MARPKIDFLQREEIERIHETTLRVLREVGVVIHSKSTCDMLTDAGAATSKDGKRILVPEELVKESVRSAPKSFVLAARDKRWDLKLPTKDRAFIANGGEGLFVKDLVTGESRCSNSEDVRDFSILINEMPQIDFWWGMVGAIEQPAHLKYLVEAKLGFEYTVKHLQTSAANAAEARHSIDMASILTEGEDALAKRPILSACLCPISPLTFEGGMAEAQAEYARAGIPVVAMTAAVAGFTSPATVSGTIAQANAENLASLVISQTAKNGAPWIYSSDSSAGDLKTGSISYGAFETCLLRAGMGQMGRYYGIPTMVAGIGLDRMSLSLGSIEEGVPHMAIQSMVDSDLGAGIGGIDEAAGASFEQLLVDCWVWEVARGFSREFDTGADAISFQTIRDGGIDGSFLSKRHTMTRFKKEFMSTSFPEATLSGPMELRPRGELIRRAHDEARKMLSRPRTPVVTKDESQRMEDMIKKLR
ncbi:MAG: trimethylamine methyltransferase family protein [Candidatus Thermoplasmatota archaeon]|nr:trimethylamine methyltransferase family protein [Candidatus Thermoplasmatota archaeon]